MLHGKYSHFFFKRVTTLTVSFLGFTQSGPLFHAKTKGLEKLLTKVLAPASIAPKLIYPTGPNPLTPTDIPGYRPPVGADADAEPPAMWAWWRKDDATGVYRHFDKGLAVVADAIAEAGGIDGVCGFSQGGALSSIVAAALEEGRDVPEGEAGEWARKLRDANGGRAAKFCVVYSGFWPPVDSMQWLYEPKLVTPSLHFIGSLDTVVDESRSRMLIDRCTDPAAVVHPGGHFVPVSKEWVMALAGFIKQHGTEARAGL